MLTLHDLKEKKNIVGGLLGWCSLQRYIDKLLKTRKQLINNSIAQKKLIKRERKKKKKKTIALVYL